MNQLVPRKSNNRKELGETVEDANLTYREVFQV